MESTARPTNKSLEMEKSKAPTFSGKTLDFPEFKRSWQAIAGVYWDDANQVEQIKHKVDQKTRRIISRCGSMKNVWEALDKEYAQEEEVIIAVNEELKNLTSSMFTVRNILSNSGTIFLCWKKL
jgi:muconolactone delta-isomerase